MNGAELISILEESPIVSAVKDEEGLSECLRSDCRIVFVLFGNVLNVADIVSRIKRSGRLALVHIDLIEGLSQKEIAVDFIREKTEADGIISTRQQLIRYARGRGLLTVQRFFLLDSLALGTIERQTAQYAPDLMEVLPGCLPKVIRRICASSSVPLIAGGLIQDKEDIMTALEAGAVGISATRPEIWRM
ncbi:MAG: glycerol-3-phosphate responsive antiterminator [Clostridia bacterium]|nr:glycerol-3-phosphate responsive antiterminator [Clostridia bacterium]